MSGNHYNTRMTCRSDKSILIGSGQRSTRTGLVGSGRRVSHQMATAPGTTDSLIRRERDREYKKTKRLAPGLEYTKEELATLKEL